MGSASKKYVNTLGTQGANWQWRELNLDIGTVQIDENESDRGWPPWPLNEGVAAALKRYRDMGRQNAEPRGRVFLDEHDWPVLGVHEADRVLTLLEKPGPSRLGPTCSSAA